MGLSNAIYRIMACAWGLKDRDYSSFLIASARKELAFDRCTLDTLVLTRLREIFRHAESTSAYYAKAFADYGVSTKDLLSLEDVRRFPCLTRDILRNGLPEIISGGTVRKSWSKSATGGTTSSPVAFYRDREALWRKNAFTEAMDEWYGRMVGVKSAFLWGAPQDFPGRPSLGMRLRDSTYLRSLMIPSAPLDETIMMNHLERLDMWRPVFLQAQGICCPHF